MLTCWYQIGCPLIDFAITLLLFGQLKNIFTIINHMMSSIFFRDGIPSLSSSYKIPGLVPACWLLFQCF